MNQDDVKVAFYLKKNETNAESRCPVMGRLTIGRSESVFSAKMLAPLSLWMSSRAKGKSAEAVEINHRLDELRASAVGYSLLGFGSVVHRQVRPVPACGAETGSEHDSAIYVAPAYGNQ